MQPQQLQGTDSLNIKKYWNVPTPLQGNIFIYGRVGSGKTCKALTVAAGYKDRGYKIWDMFGGKRSEGPYWSLPSDDNKLWEQIKNETFDFEVPGPKLYQVNIIYPMFANHLSKELPQDSPRVKSKIFTIPIKSLDERDVNLCIGGLGSNASFAFRTLMKNMNSKSNGEDALALFDTELSAYKNTPLYRLFFQPLAEERLLSSENCDLNLNLIEEAKQKDVVTVLCLDFVPEQFKYFVMGYLLRNIWNLANTDKIHKRNLAIWREASAFMKVSDKSSQTDEITQIFRNQFSDAIRYARSGLYHVVDTQSPHECAQIVSGQEDLLCINELPSTIDREDLCTPLRKDRRMNPAQIRALSMLPIEQMCVVERGKRAVILKRINPPRCRYFKSEYGTFYSVWRKEVDKWMNTKNDIDKIEEEYKSRKDFVLTKHAEFANKQKEKKSSAKKKRLTGEAEDSLGQELAELDNTFKNKRINEGVELPVDNNHIIETLDKGGSTNTNNNDREDDIFGADFD